jgi:hypothetical protein
MTSFNVLLMFNRTVWDYKRRDEEIQKIKDYFAPNVKVNIYIAHTNFIGFRWKEARIGSNPNINVLSSLLIEEESYDNTFTRYALKWGWDNEISLDAIVGILNNEDWRSSSIQGVTTDCTQGLIQTYVLAPSENSGLWVNGEMKYTSLFANVTHELCHVFAQYCGVPDRTHKLLDNATVPFRTILTDYKETWAYTFKKKFWYKIRAFYRLNWKI